MWHLVLGVRKTEDAAISAKAKEGFQIPFKGDTGPVEPATVLVYVQIVTERLLSGKKIPAPKGGVFTPIGNKTS